MIEFRCKEYLKSAEDALVVVDYQYIAFTLHSNVDCLEKVYTSKLLIENEISKQIVKYIDSLM